MKACIVIPVFNSGGRIYDVIADVKKHTGLPLWVIDDGSEPAIKKEKGDSSFEIHRFEKNRGKGAALAWAIKNLSSDFSHMVTLDGDGQHLAKDVNKLLAIAETHPEALVVGARSFKDNVPGISRFGRNFSNFWVWYQTGQKISDSQSGFRLYPLQPLKNIIFFTKRYDFEIEVLVRALWKGTPLKEVSIDVIYPKKDERISHFDKIYDNFRITFLNIILIAYSLLFYQRGPIKMLIGVLWGLVAYLSPDWTVSLFLTILGSVLFKLNFPLVLIVVLVLKLL